MTALRDTAPGVSSGPAAELVEEGEGRATLRLSGRWSLQTTPPDPQPLFAALAQGRVQRLHCDAADVESWDSTLPGFLATLMHTAREQDCTLDTANLPQGVQRLLRLAAATAPAHAATVETPVRHGLLSRIGQRALHFIAAVREIWTFLGEVLLSGGDLLHGRVTFRRTDFWLILQQAGADALPIVSLVSFLVGLILGYIGDQQLAQFGARIYVADLVGLSVVMQMGALVTAIVLAGRTGASYAAQLGAMQANEEIDALRTLGISPIGFLVLPRLLALVMMTPLLALYADLLGILGGAFAGMIGGLTLTEYGVETMQAIGWNHFFQGLINATVYGAIVAFTGCLRGMQSGRDASAVGAATTSAVVTAVLWIVIAAAILTVIYDAVGM